MCLTGVNLIIQTFFFSSKFLKHCSSNQICSSHILKKLSHGLYADFLSTSHVNNNI